MTSKLLSTLPTDLNPQKIPQHIAIIMDGNARWATSRGLPRIAGHFLLWQMAYTEMYFTDILWPDFNIEAFYQALLSYQRRVGVARRRHRRFGQVKASLSA